MRPSFERKALGGNKAIEYIVALSKGEFQFLVPV